MVQTQRWSVKSSGDVARAIGDIRRINGLTQHELAEQSGISRDSLAQLESGRSGRAVDQILRILRRLGAEVTITREDHDGEA